MIVNEIETTRRYNGWARAKVTAQAVVLVHHHSEPSIENDRRPIHGAQLAEMIAEMTEEKT